MVEPPALYLWIHFKLIETGQCVMPPTRVIETFRRIVKFPKPMNHMVLNELEHFGLIRRINRKKGYYINKIGSYPFETSIFN
jgi:hypothetical protein